MATDRTTPREGVVTQLSPVFKLIEEPKFAELYAYLREEPATIPELLPDLSIEKSTAYNYVELLEQAGLVTEVGTKETSALYKAEEFHVTIRISETEIDVTPELARVIAQRTANPEVDRFIDQYGLSTLAEFIPLAQRYADGEIPGFVHLSQGQEAVAVGTCGALAPDDHLTSTHRAHGHSLAAGLSPEQLAAEIVGLEGDNSDLRSSKAEFELYTDTDDQWRWRLVHDNGNIIADSGESYSSKSMAQKGLGSVKLNALGAAINEI
jgi:uncharacterized protein YegP (UPF0339 family)/predicted transcriptional regulator